jgi:hypothetical protein
MAKIYIGNMEKKKASFRSDQEIFWEKIKENVESKRKTANNIKVGMIFGKGTFFLKRSHSQVRNNTGIRIRTTAKSTPKVGLVAN